MSLFLLLLLLFGIEEFYLLVSLENVAAEEAAGSIARDVAEHLEILRVVRHVEYPVDGVVHEQSGVAI